MTLSTSSFYLICRQPRAPKRSFQVGNGIRGTTSAALFSISPLVSGYEIARHYKTNGLVSRVKHGSSTYIQAMRLSSAVKPEILYSRRQLRPSETGWHCLHTLHLVVISLRILAVWASVLIPTACTGAVPVLSETNSKMYGGMFSIIIGC